MSTQSCGDSMKNRQALLFCTRSYKDLSLKLAESASMQMGLLECQDFPDGEHYHRIDSSLDDREVYLVSGTVSDEETLELFDLANVIVDAGALSLHIILPYFGYSTMERAVHAGEAVKAKYRARLLSNGIPRAPLGNRFYLLDLHSEGIPQYFESGIQSKHVYAKPLITRAALELAKRHGKSDSDSEASPNFVLASTDAGRMKWVESLARDMAVAPAFAYKKRLDGRSTVSLGVSGPVQDQLVIIYDDMIRTGSSLINAADAYLKAGARAVAAISTHAVLPKDSLAKIESTGLFKELVVSDSHPRARQLESSFLQVKSCAELFLPYILESRKELVEHGKS